jgi:RNA polymerase subunit RPABC4/transcription elongation factor Spt4
MLGMVVILKCKVCGYEIRSDWKFCPMCGDAIVCHKLMGKSPKSSAGAKSAKKTAKKA